MKAVPTTKLPDGEPVTILGQGTWYMGDDPRKKKEEVVALKLGIELGLTLIDTAEMYANGRAEEVVAEAIEGQRGKVFIVSKVLPSNASRTKTIAACERSLKRLNTEVIDLYLLHWRQSTPLEDTLSAFATLQKDGKIRHWGVSNFDMSDMQDLWGLKDGKACATNQVLYNITRRGIEFDLLPACRKRKMPIMAYSPIEQGRILKHPALTKLAREKGATAAQIALAYLLCQKDVIVIPKTSSQERMRENRAALDVKLSDSDMKALDAALPPPKRAEPLAML
jgi:diketogulonate reductase-like aldo/keto reductase